mmetsp:Transcript_44617/g.83325  ORF Transcript_44617/g.83325 Transcript_44617/m.83325 type:complete len:173 (-) Transcript_44617:65-583(-)
MVEPRQSLPGENFEWSDSSESFQSPSTSRESAFSNCSDASLKRQMRKNKRQKELQAFLKKHGFSEDVHAPKQPQGCFILRKESMYPIHVAAQMGNRNVVRQLLSEGAEPEQKTSKGRTALDIAQAANDGGSHLEVLVLLQSRVRFVSAREAKELLIEISDASFSTTAESQFE